MSATGYIQVRAYTGRAGYPLKDVAVTVTSTDGTAIAMALTDQNGRINPISIPVPDKQDSLQPDPPEQPFAAVNLYARLRGYEQVEAENLQVFADTTTVQNLELVPLAELPLQWSQRVVYDTPPQNL